MLSKRESKVMIIGLSIIMLVVVFGLVYAAFTGQLRINGGQAVGRKSKWDIHFENISNITTTGTAKVLNNKQPTIDSNNRITITDYEVSLISPGDSISFTVDVINDGNYNAEIIAPLTVPSPVCDVNGDTTDTSAVNMCKHISYTLTYEGGASVEVGDVLYAKDHKVLKVTLTYEDFSVASDLPEDDVSISNLGITINFGQQGKALVKDNGEAADYRVYHVGDKITLNDEDYYIIEDSNAGQDYVVALKENPLTVAEVNLYGGVGTENNHVNRYTRSSIGTALNKNGYGCLAYYSSETCGYVEGTLDTSNCKNQYEDSDIKYIVDNWANSKFGNNLKNVDGYKARIPTFDEVSTLPNDSVKIINSNYSYWLMTIHWKYYISYVAVYGYHSSYGAEEYSFNNAVRPVINVYKSAIQSNNQG